MLSSWKHYPRSDCPRRHKSRHLLVRSHGRTRGWVFPLLEVYQARRIAHFVGRLMTVSETWIWRRIGKLEHGSCLAARRLNCEYPKYPFCQPASLRQKAVLKEKIGLLSLKFDHPNISML